MSKKKELLAKLLEKLSEEDLEQLLGEDDEAEDVEEEPTHTHTINSSRRGSGHAKKQRQSREPQNEKRNGKKRKRRGRISKGKQCRVLPMDIYENRPNKFEDLIDNVALDAGEQRELAEAKEADEKARSVKPRFKRQSRGNSLVDVECCVCGEEDTVSASMVHDARRWKCNECSTQPGY